MERLFDLVDHKWEDDRKRLLLLRSQFQIMKNCYLWKVDLIRNLEVKSKTQAAE
jgi:hypothetical protein